MITTEPATLSLMFKNAQPGGTFFVGSDFMYTYPKPIFTNDQLIAKLISAGMIISDVEAAKSVLHSIGYYRLKGYCFDKYDNHTKKFRSGTSFSDIVRLYNFDSELSHIIFNFLSKIEVALRTRVVESLSIHNDALVLNDPSVFDDKELFWKNNSTISSEIARSNDVFIKHNFKKYNGAIPVWATVEVMSFGTLSKVVKNLKTGTKSSYSVLARNYRFLSAKGNSVAPSKDMLSSWIQSVSILRNICAHNSRIYNRTINTAPQILHADTLAPKPSHNGLYQVLLAMKYLRPSDTEWNSFVHSLKKLIDDYSDIVDISSLNFPSDWKDHFNI
ncbi:MAG: Abi family protein [Oscillospiraceae bacterium]|nr:Abi family protein [Oscillospiraceae bacterium]